jgi:N-methylhydantoinase A
LVGAARIRRLFARMEAEGRRRLAETFTGPVSVRRSLDTRYGEQIFEISVPLDGVDMNAPDLVEKIVERFHQRHEELYTYSAPGQEVVLVNGRLAVIGELPTLPAEPVIEKRRALRPSGSRRVYLGSWLDVPVYDLDGLSPGHEEKGPAIFESATTTVLVPSGARMLATPRGWLDIRLT